MELFVSYPVFLSFVISVQCGDEVCGSVMVRSVDNRQGICPVKYLQEV